MTTLLAGAAAHRPGELLTSAGAEARTATASAGSAPRPGMIERVTSITLRHIMSDDAPAPDLAAAVGPVTR